GDVNIMQGYIRKVAANLPATAMALFRADQFLLAQSGEHAPNNDGVGFHHVRQSFRCEGHIGFSHMEEDVEYAGKPGIAFHNLTCNFVCYVRGYAGFFSYATLSVT